MNLLNHLGRYAEAKCVAVNPRRPYQLAVGANDFYVRLYDTRMIKLARLQVRDNDVGLSQPMSLHPHVCKLNDSKVMLWAKSNLVKCRIDVI